MSNNSKKSDEQLNKEIKSLQKEIIQVEDIHKKTKTNKEILQSQMLGEKKQSIKDKLVEKVDEKMEILSLILQSSDKLKKELETLKIEQNRRLLGIKGGKSKKHKKTIHKKHKKTIHKKTNHKKTIHKKHKKTIHKKAKKHKKTKKV